MTPGTILALSTVGRGRKNFRGMTDKYAPPARLDNHFDLALNGSGFYDTTGNLLSQNLRDFYAIRQNRYQENWMFFNGHHYINMFEATGKKKFVINYCKTSVNLSSDWLVAKGISFTAAEGNEAVAELVNRVWDFNDGDALLWKVSQFGGIAGDAYVYVTVNTKDSAGADLPQDQWTTKLCALDPRWVYPQWSPENPDELSSCIIQFPYTDANGSLSLFTVYITPLLITTWINKQQVSQSPNPLGKVNVIHIKHEVVADSLFGSGEIDPIKELNQRVNNVGGIVERILEYHAEPTTIVYGATVSSLEKGSSKCWSGLPTDGKVENLELKGDLKATFDWFTQLKQELGNIAEIPAVLLNSTEFKHLSNTSGIAIQLMFQPLVGKTSRRRLTYGKGLSKVGELILLAHEKIIGDDIKILADNEANIYSLVTNFSSALPKDEAAMIDLISKKLASGLISQAEAIRQCGDVTNIKRLLVELAADRRAELAMAAEKEVATQGGEPALSCVFLASPFLSENLDSLLPTAAESQTQE